MANVHVSDPPENRGPPDALSDLTPEQAAAQQAIWNRYAEEVQRIREVSQRLGLHAVCPDRACGRARACCGRETKATRKLPPCFFAYREEYRFMTLSPWSIPAILGLVHGGSDDPALPETPGYGAWVERVLRGMTESLQEPGRSALGMLAVIYGEAGLSLLRRPRGAPSGRSYETNPDAFALAMAKGDWRRPLLPR